MKPKLKFCISAFILILVAGCNKTEYESILGNDKLIFIEHFKITDGVLISGKEPPLLCIDFPTYSFNSKTKILEGSINFELTNTLDLIFGNYRGLTGTAGSGAASGLYPVDNFPYQRGKIKILGYDTSGTTRIAIDNDTLLIKSGDFWKNEISYFDTITFNGETSICRNTFIETVKNHGIINKKDIIRWDY